MSKKVLFTLLALMFTSSLFAQHDQYGAWKKERILSVDNYYLKSTSSNQNAPLADPVTLYIDSESHRLKFFLDDDCILHEIGKSKSYYGWPVVELEMSFDDGEYNYFTFLKAHNILSFIVFDRFKGIENLDATNMIKQMANKSLLSIRYKLKDGSTKIQRFNLEGLEALLDVIYK